MMTRTEILNGIYVVELQYNMIYVLSLASDRLLLFSSNAQNCGEHFQNMYKSVIKPI